MRNIIRTALIIGTLATPMIAMADDAKKDAPAADAKKDAPAADAKKDPKADAKAPAKKDAAKKDAAKKDAAKDAKDPAAK
jgi:hypothetical protein